MFAACSTQWSYSGGMAPVPTGLPAERVKVLMDAHGVDSTPEFWERFHVLEAEALDCMHREANRRRS